MLTVFVFGFFASCLFLTRPSLNNSPFTILTFFTQDMLSLCLVGALVLINKAFWLISRACSWSCNDPFPAFSFFFFFPTERLLLILCKGTNNWSSIIRLSSKLCFFSWVCLHVPLPSEVSFKVTAQPGCCGDSFSTSGVRVKESEVCSDPARAGEDFGGSEKRRWPFHITATKCALNFWFVRACWFFIYCKDFNWSWQDISLLSWKYSIFMQWKW